MQWIYGDNAIKVVCNGVNTCNLDVSCRWLFRNLGKHTVTLLQKCRDMTAWHIVIAILIASLVVKVGHIGIIRNSVIKLNHRVFWLNDVQLWEMFLPLLVFFISYV